MKRFKIKPFNEVINYIDKKPYLQSPEYDFKILYIHLRQDCLPYIAYKAEFVHWYGTYSRMNLKEFNILFPLLECTDYLKYEENL